MDKITSDSPILQYFGNGTTKEFAFNRMYWKEKDICVYLGEELQTTGYTLRKDSANNGVTVVFAEAPAKGVLITIRRIVDLDRVSDFSESGLFRADVTNDEFNHIYAALQQNEQNAAESMKLPITALNVKSTLPTPIAGHAILWSDDGKSLVNSNDTFNNIVSTATSLKNQAAASQTAAKNSETAAANSQKAAANSATQAANTAATFDANAASKTTSYNSNAATKLADYNANTVTKTDAYNYNATTKLTAYNANTVTKTNDFNDNAEAKKTEVQNVGEEKIATQRQLLADMETLVGYTEIFGGSPADGTDDEIIGGIL